MSDDGFNFAPPPERREAKGFEPPPWEREAFDELARRKAEEAEREAAVAAALAAEAAEPPATGPGPEAMPLAGLPEVRPGEDFERQAVKKVQEAPEPQAVPAEGKTEKTAEISEAQLISMIADLRQEEEPISQKIFPIGLLATLITGLVGIVLLLWGVVQLGVSARDKLGPQAYVGGTILAVLGGIFVILASWVGARTLRQRGVI